MSKTISLEAKIRQDTGKGASRRLRRNGDAVPAIIYGGHAKPINLTLEQRHVRKAAEQDAFYASILDLNVAGTPEKAVLKAVQRHPYKPFITHLDFLRVSPTDVITMRIPLHFMNAETAPGLEAGGIISHNISDIEIKCQAQHLPEFIELDLGQLELNAVLHLSDLKLPKGVELALDISDASHNHPVASMHLPRVVVEEEPVVEAETAVVPVEGETPAEGETSE